MNERRRWSPLLAAGLPLWAFFTLLVVAMHPGTRFNTGAYVAFRLTITAVALGVLVYFFVGRSAARERFRLRVLVVHAGLAVLFSLLWIFLNISLDLIGHARPAGSAPGLSAYVLLGICVYAVIAGASYAAHAGERAARAEAHAARAQLATLRTQLNPHFLFNALHAVVQLIPVEPARATEAAERISDLLRAAIDEDRDLVPLRDEMAFVERYVDVERLRFGDRLSVRIAIGPDALDLLVPSFGMHCLVENAVRHGVEPSIGATTIDISVHVVEQMLMVIVSDDGRAGSASSPGGTGLARLRERVGVLFGTRATLATGPLASGGYEARLAVPAREEEA